MKKFAISLLAVLALLVCVVTLTAPQAQAADDVVLYHCICGNKHSTALTEGEITWKEGTEACYNGCDGEILEWTPWGATSAANAGNYYMIQDYTTARGFSAAVEGAINVDMNGYNIQVTSAARAINAGSGNTINYCNTKTTGGLITAKGMASREATVIKVYSGTTLNLYGVDVAAYDGGNSTTTGGAVMVDNDCTFTMIDGTITGAPTSSVGGAIYSKSILCLTDVHVVGAAAGGNGGSICAAAGSITMNGGSITGGSTTADGKSGGNLYVGANTAVNLTDVTISGGTAEENGGNVYVLGGHIGDLNLTRCVIYGGVAGNNGGNLWIGTAGTTTQTDAEGVETTTSALARFENLTIYGGQAISGGSLCMARRINMVGGTIGIDTDGNKAGGVATNRGGNVFINDAELVMNLGARITYGDSGSTDGGNVYITGANGNGKLSINHTSSVDNGQNTADGGNVYVNAGSMYMSLNAIVSGGDTTGNGANVFLASGTYAEMEGSSVIAGGGFTGVYGTGNTTATCNDGGNVYISSGAEFTMSDSSNVRNGMDVEAGYQSGNFYVAGTLNISGSATVYGGITNNRDRNIHILGGTLNISGNAKVDGGITAAKGTVKLSDNVTVDTYRDGRADRTVYLAAGVTLDATGLTDGACVKLYDSLASERKIADVTAEQTWIKDAVALSETNNLAGYMISREIVEETDAEGNTTQTVELWLRQAIPAQVEVSQGNIYDYQTYEAAVAACQEGQTVLLDLMGQEVTGLTIPGNLKLIDSANDDYTTQTGSFTGTVSGTVYSLVDANGKSYLVVENEGVYSAHRYEVQLTHISLDATNDALGYKAALSGDDVVMAHVTRFGFNLWVDGGQVKTYSKTGVQELTLRLKGIMAAGGGEMNINANAFVSFDVSEDKITSADETTSMKAVLSAVNDAIVADANAYTEEQVNSVKGLIETYSDAMTGWNIEAIKTWTVPVVEDNEAV